MAQTSNSKYQCPAGTSANSAKKLVELPSRNGSELPMQLDHEDTNGSRPFRARSFGDRIESATVHNTERKRSSVDGCSVAVELPSRNCTSLNTFGAAGFSDVKPGSRKSSFGERFEFAGVQSTEKSSVDGGKDGQQGAVSKWHKFQEIVPIDQHRRPPAVRTMNLRPFQTASSDLVRRQPVTSSPVQITDHSPVKHREPPIQTSSSDQHRTKSTTSSLARTMNLHPFQTASSDLVRRQPVTSSPIQMTNHSPVRHQEPPIQTSGSDQHSSKSTVSSLVKGVSHGSFPSEVQQSLPSRKPEVACVTPQVRQPLRALRLDQDTLDIGSAEDGVYRSTQF